MNMVKKGEVFRCLGQFDHELNWAASHLDLINQPVSEVTE